MTDNVNAPSYYVMPDGTQVISLTRWLNSNGGQAVQYIARSTRSDEVFKGSRVEDLRKSVVFIQNEIARLEWLEANSADEYQIRNGFGETMRVVTEPRAPRKWLGMENIPVGVKFRWRDWENAPWVASYAVRDDEGMYSYYFADTDTFERHDAHEGELSSWGPFTEVL